MRKSVVGLVSVLAGLQWVTSLLAQAPVTRRLSVREGPDGYAVVGFRAETGRQERFRMTTGLTAEQIREQLRAVRWTSANDRLDEPPAELAALRDGAGDVRERLVVRLTAPGGRAWSVAYTVWPVRYSRLGLISSLQAAFGAGAEQVDSPERLRVVYTAADVPLTLTVQADQLPDEKNRWILSHTIVDPRLSPLPTGPRTEPAGPAGPIELIQVYPPLPPDTQPGGEFKTPPTATAPAPAGWKTVYPPKDSSSDDR